MEEKIYKVGDSVPETGTYICYECHSEAGVEEKIFEKGQTFPEHFTCGENTIWIKKEDLKNKPC